MDLETAKQGQNLIESYGPYGFSVFLLIAIVGAATWAYVKIIKPEREADREKLEAEHAAEREERKTEREQWQRERAEHRQSMELMRKDQREDRDKFISALAEFNALIRTELAELSAKIDRHTGDPRD